MQTLFRTKGPPSPLTVFNAQDLLEMGSILRSIGDMRIPRLAVCGSQSSGKTSLLNSILGMDILPTGEEMVTRVPLELELRAAPEASVEFGEYEGGSWVVHKQFSPGGDIARYIREETIRRAGESKMISRECIHLRISGPVVPNMTLIDLPGLTNIALVDKGQPSDIKKQIVDLVAEYISSPETIIVAIIPARVDIEADAGLELVKQHDPMGERSIGILTKCDLMNPTTSVAHLLRGRISRALNLRHGYFAVKNRHNRRDTYQQGIAQEAEFFSCHAAYADCRQRVGVPAVTNFLSRLLIDVLREGLPDIRHKMERDKEDIQKKLAELGEAENPTTTITRLANRFVACLEERGPGRRLRDILTTLRTSILDARPALDQQYLDELLSSHEGNHMPFPTIPVELLESIVRDPTRRPMHAIVMPPADICCRAVAALLRDLLDQLLVGLRRFPELCTRLRHSLREDLLEPGLRACHEACLAAVEDQEAYVWTHEETFYTELARIRQDSSALGSKALMRLCTLYMDAIKSVLADIVPKIVMRTMIRQAQARLTDTWLDLVRDPSLLEEDPMVSSEREELRKRLSALDRATFLLEQILTTS